MINATVFDTFISIGVEDRVYSIAKSMYPEWRKNGMDGHDMEDFMKRILSDTLLDQVRMDPESGGFYCYLNLVNGKGAEVVKEDIKNLRKWIHAVEAEISMKYLRHIEDSLKRKEDLVEFTRETEHLKDTFKITNLGIFEEL